MKLLSQNTLRNDGCKTGGFGCVPGGKDLVGGEMLSLFSAAARQIRPLEAWSILQFLSAEVERLTNGNQLLPTVMQMRHLMLALPGPEESDKMFIASMFCRTFANAMLAAAFYLIYDL
jgi:hypothetical protein